MIPSFSSAVVANKECTSPSSNEQTVNHDEDVGRVSLATQRRRQGCSLCQTLGRLRQLPVALAALVGAALVAKTAQAAVQGSYKEINFHSGEVVVLSYPVEFSVVF